uniref:Interferon stimulated exonuclease gene 20 n=1 Tax=Zosterops lateralis melanops TaxID=1220523 RepID=A0A8D2NXW6_ZOSLA
MGLPPFLGGRNFPWSMEGAAGGLNPLPCLQVLRILAGKVVVGHAIHNDFKALRYYHPKALTRDTSLIPLLNQDIQVPCCGDLCLSPQVGKSGHSSVEDARATMELYKVVEEEWEQHLIAPSTCPRPRAALGTTPTAAGKSPPRWPGDTPGTGGWSYPEGA